MKKVVLVASLALIGFSMNAQDGFKLGANLGLPVGDAGDVSGFSVGLDAQYMFETAGEFDLGVATGFTNSFGKTIGDSTFSIEVDDVQFLPLAGVARYKASEEFSIGADLGYALGINDGNDGGFYYRPTVGYAVSEGIEINASYTGISLDGGTWSTVNLGVLFSL
ncbi:MAG: outer membrane beta-barrel protein [Maribacter sp.]|uniref:outer membrane beta-barrel protein n=1 Tax=Maribacter sp. TaxID=1897614 RepID=UPI003C74C6F9